MHDAASPPPPGTPADVPMTRPSARFMLSHPAHLIALGFGSGLSRKAPGTAGTLWAWL
ncbi:MAG: phosphatidylglycerophosphatase A, partial [Burkholderiaceae bacterium]